MEDRYRLLMVCDGLTDVEWENLSDEQLMVMLDAFERCGVRTLHITGGEPMIRKDQLLSSETLSS